LLRARNFRTFSLIIFLMFDVFASIVCAYVSKVKEDDAVISDEMVNEWRQAAVALDRLLLLLFCIMFVAGTLAVFLRVVTSAPH
jgi:hypothetical protein